MGIKGFLLKILYFKQINIIFCEPNIFDLVHGDAIIGHTQKMRGDLRLEGWFQLLTFALQQVYMVGNILVGKNLSTG